MFTFIGRGSYWEKGTKFNHCGTFFNYCLGNVNLVAQYSILQYFKTGVNIYLYTVLALVYISSVGLETVMSQVIAGPREAQKWKWKCDQRIVY